MDSLEIVLVACVLSGDAATRFNASMNGFRALVSAVIVAGFDDLVVLVALVVDGSFCNRRWERPAEPFLVADRVRYRLRVAAASDEGAAGVCDPAFGPSMSRESGGVTTGAEKVLMVFQLTKKR